MAYFFDLEKAAKESGLSEETVRKIEKEVREEFPDDDMMYELHVLRAIESTVHPLPLKAKTSVSA
jgi:hypothetical protein